MDLIGEQPDYREYAYEHAFDAMKTPDEAAEET
jgi:hypothetical protein